MSRPGDHLTVSTHMGDVRLVRTPQGVEVNMPSPQAQLTPGQARSLSLALNTISRGGGSQQQSFQQQGGFQQPGMQSQGGMQQSQGGIPQQSGWGQQRY